MVDFPSVRSSLSTQLTAKLTQEARNDPQARRKVVDLYRPVVTGCLERAGTLPDS